MNNLLKYGALAVFVGATGAAHADSAETKGGIKIKSEDGRFEAKIGGRIHFDGNLFLDDDDLGVPGETSSTFFRRARITLEGKAYGWKYKFEEDFTGSGTSGFREMWLGTSLGGANVRIGQAKPYRGMEELTSSNEIVFMERPYATASALYEGRQFSQGLFFDGHVGAFTWGLAGYNLRSASGPETEGVGFSGRATFAPINTETATLHIGLTGSVDNPDSDNTGAPLEVEVGAKPAGRLTSTQNIAASTGAQTTYGLELAGKAGPFYIQSEAAQAKFDEDVGSDPEVMTYYVQTSFFLTGETKPYDAKKGVFKSPKPKGSNGAIELKARYDFIENKDVDNSEVSQAIIGANWYVNPNVRFMLEYIMGTNEAKTAVDGGQGVDISTLAARAQVNF